MWSAETVAVVALTFFIGGFVKGVVGLGLPTISLAALTATLGLHPAMALVLAPSLATNLLQATRGGHGKAVVRRLWPYLLAAALGIWLGVRILVVTDRRVLILGPDRPEVNGSSVYWNAEIPLAPQAPETGRIRAVITDQGRIECEKVICCAGQWTRDFAARFGVNVIGFR